MADPFKVQPFQEYIQIKEEVTQQDLCVMSIPNISLDWLQPMILNSIVMTAATCLALRPNHSLTEDGNYHDVILAGHACPTRQMAGFPFFSYARLEIRRYS